MSSWAGAPLADKLTDRQTGVNVKWSREGQGKLPRQIMEEARWFWWAVLQNVPWLKIEQWPVHEATENCTDSEHKTQQCDNRQDKVEKAERPS